MRAEPQSGYLGDRSAAKRVGRITEAYTDNGVKDALKDRSHRDVVHGSIFRGVVGCESRSVVVDRRCSPRRLHRSDLWCGGGFYGRRCGHDHRAIE